MDEIEDVNENRKWYGSLLMNVMYCMGSMRNLTGGHRLVSPLTVQVDRWNIELHSGARFGKKFTFTHRVWLRVRVTEL